jgi:hypothetical protein
MNPLESIVRHLETQPDYPPLAVRPATGLTGWDEWVKSAVALIARQQRLIDDQHKRELELTAERDRLLLGQADVRRAVAEAERLIAAEQARLADVEGTP